jgi:histone-binding protein RBBP4|mmetsp:Transcript_8636/g.29560  ORF Transcript_8636/g.29560 Transcript_8636/m.29560 type:complete len:114 (+) Transcript_8636:145-486(+)
MANAHSTMDAGRQSVYCYHHETFCGWLDIFRSTSNDYDLHKLLLGTHTSNGEQNYLMVAAVKLPTADTDFVENSLTNPPSAKGKIEIKIKILHQGEVNRCIAMGSHPRRFCSV